MVAWPSARRPETPCVGPTLGTIPSGPRYCLRSLQRSFAIQRFRPKPAGRNVIPINELAFSAIRQPDFKAPASRDGFVFDDANASVIHGWPASETEQSESPALGAAGPSRRRGMLAVLDLNPMWRAAGTIWPVTVFRDQSLQPHQAGMAE